MFYLLCLLVFGAGTYLYNFGFKQKSTVVKVGGTVVAFGAIVLIILTAVYGHVGKGWGKHNGEAKPICPMMEMQRPMMNMGGCGNRGDVEIQRPPIGPDKYHQPVKQLMTDPMESKPKN